jgi:dihydroorotate dehydrogenase (NAD+) catalytic subunit
MEIGNDPVEAARLTEAVKRISRRPVIVKLSPHVRSIAEIARAVEAAGADALSVINTILGMSVDIYKRRPRLGAKMGGLSGPAIKPLAVRMVFEASRAVQIPIIGIGGIATAQDALEFIIAGATAIQVGTANYYDPAVTIKIIAGLEAYSREQKIEQIHTLIGSIEV